MSSLPPLFSSLSSIWLLLLLISKDFDRAEDTLLFTSSSFPLMDGSSNFWSLLDFSKSWLVEPVILGACVSFLRIGGKCKADSLLPSILSELDAIDFLSSREDRLTDISLWFFSRILALTFERNLDATALVWVRVRIVFKSNSYFHTYSFSRQAPALWFHQSLWWRSDLHIPSV